MIKVLRIDFLPVMQDGLTLDKLYNKDINVLHKNILDTITEISGETFQVVGIESTNEIPIKQDRFQYTNEEYINVLAGKSPAHQPDYASYKWIIDKFDLVNRKNENEFDEVHMFGSPFLGFYESLMIGERSIWCNSPAYRTMCDNFCIMGYSYERGISEATENLGHRAESILSYWNRDFFRDFVSAVGSIHIPHNATKDYDWANSANKLCYADKYPNAFYKGKTGCFFLSLLYKSFIREKDFIPVLRDSTYWNSNSLDYFKYWFKHLPKEALDIVLHVNKIT